MKTEEKETKIRMIKHSIEILKNKLNELSSEADSTIEKVIEKENELRELQGEEVKTVKLNGGEYTETQLRDILNNRFL